jgi:hypothetical protein
MGNGQLVEVFVYLVLLITLGINIQEMLILKAL